MSNNPYTVLMERSLRTHEHFHKLFHQYFSKSGGRENEPAEVTEARNTFDKANNELWNNLLDPLQRKFHADPESAIDEVLDFLEVDIPAFRCGYLKEYFLDHIKSVGLTDVQKNRLRSIAVKLCEENTVRREFRRWIKLMIAIADSNFAARLNSLAKQLDEENQRATILMLKKLVKHRKDLSPVVTVTLKTDVYLG
jgi:hypothetical protein